MVMRRTRFPRAFSITPLRGEILSLRSFFYIHFALKLTTPRVAMK